MSATGRVPVFKKSCVEEIVVDLRDRIDPDCKEWLTLGPNPRYSRERQQGWAALKSWMMQVYKEYAPEPVIFLAAEGGLRVEEAEDGWGVEEVPAPGGQPAAVTELYDKGDLEDFIAAQNQGAFQELVAQLRSPMGVVPFVGAGISQSLGFKGWGEFLKTAAEYHSDPAAVRAAVDAGNYMHAADLLWQESPDRFQREVSREFGRPIGNAEVRTGAVSVLPGLCAGPVITTNFDHILETAFKVKGRPFERVVPGPQLDLVLRAMQRNENVLLKMHGDADDRTLRTFTGLEYERHYTDTDLMQPGLSVLASIMFTNRPLLFLGCSLDRDRTVDILKKIHASVPGIVHYAIVEGTYRVDRFRERRSALDQAGISPLWYAPGDYQRIEGLLRELVQEASTRLWSAGRAGGGGQPNMPKGSQPFVELRSHETAEPAAVGAAVSRVSRKILEGGMAFFLGSYAHFGAHPSGKHLFQMLADEFGLNIDIDKETVLQRTEVIQFIADRVPRSDVWAAVKRSVSRPVKPSLLIEILATLPAAMRELGSPDEVARQWIFTTNYDTVIEERFRNRGEPFHLLYYQADGENQGRFLHCRPDGMIRIVERPENIHALDPPCSVIVKLDGGIAPYPQLPESAALTPADFYESAGRLPGNLPLAVQHVLRDRSLLVLGSGLREPHIQKMIRWSAQTDRAGRSWAVDLKPNPLWVDYWSAVGLDMIDSDLEQFTVELHRELLRGLKPPSP